MAEPSEINVAWAAGIVEGEGTIYAPRWRYAPLCIAVCMTDRDIIDRLNAIFPCPGIREKARGHEGRRKRAWVWQVGACADMRYVLEHIFTYLGERRKAEALKLLRVLDGLPSENGWSRSHG